MRSPIKTSSVCIIVIAFNEANGIARTLESIANQDASAAFEVVLVDDGSTDATVAIAEQVMSDYPRFRLIEHGENRGRGEARKSGIEASSAEILGFVDADIELPPNWLQACLDHLQKADAVSGIAVPDGDAAVIARISRARPRPVSGSQEITGNNILFKKAVLTAVPFPTTRLGEDFRFSMGLKEQGFRVLGISNLRVSHLEHKTLFRGIKWMFASGVDANRLLAEFRQLRLPDLSAIAFSISVVIGLVFGIQGMTAVMVLPVLFVSIVSLTFSCQRFSIFPKPWRWVHAMLLSTMFVSAYLVARLISWPGFIRHANRTFSVRRE